METIYDAEITSRIEAELKQLDVEPLFCENALKILEKRYLTKDDDGEVIEAPKDMLARVAANIAYADMFYGASYDEVYDFAKTIYTMMSNLELLPNSPALRGAGRETQQLSACFVLPVEDSRKSIFGTLMDAVDIQAFGGGTGFNFSHLRPKGSKVSSTGGEASGPISFMQIYDIAVGRVIAQGGVRQGANMGILSYNHPDVLTFIDSKLDARTLSNFNISVGVTEEFMEMAEDGAEYGLIDPHTKEVVNRVNARDVLDRVAENAWSTGDPGLVFLDRINRANPTPHIGVIESTNPCIDGDTWIITPDGPMQVKDSLGKKVGLLLDGQFHETGEEGFFSTGVREAYRVKTARGFELVATGDHLVSVASKVTREKVYTGWHRVETLEVGDKIVFSGNRGAHWGGEDSLEEGYLLGLLLGDGVLTDDDALICVWGESPGVQAVVRFAEECARKLPHRADFKGFQKGMPGRERRLKLRAVKKLAEKFGMTKGSKTATAAVEKTSIEFHRGFLRGVFDADGSVQGTHAKGVSVRLWQHDLSVLQTVQRMLARLGVISTIYENRSMPKRKEMPDGRGGTKEYWVSTGHELCIANDNLVFFAQEVGFADSEKQLMLEEHLKTYKREPNRERFVDSIAHVEGLGRREVFDARVPGVNAFDANGFYVHNCGELPLLPYESCNLASINLTKMVEETQDVRHKTRDEESEVSSLKSEVSIDYDKLSNTVRNGVHLLDNVIDMNKYPLEKIEEMTKGNRKIGLGVMGWADVLAMMGIPYNSDQALELAEEVMEFINTNAKAASVELAKTRGVFPNFKNSIHDTGKKGDMVRNASWTTIAPTGTLSTLANCSGGIEPFFMIVYRRGSIYDAEGKPTMELLMENGTFKRVGVERGFYSEELGMRIAETGSLQHIDEIPDDIKEVFVTAHDIGYEWHVKMQSAFQKHITNSVSKTINFPNDATVDDIKESYQLAYELGNIKGITVYRDGCKEYQVLSAREAKPWTAEDIVDRLKASRPRKIAGTTERIETPVGTLFMTINRTDGRLYEVFLNIGKAGADVTADAEGYGRLLSMIFKAGIPPEMVIDQLRGIGGSGSIGFGKKRVRSLPDAIARVLEMYMEEHLSESAASIAREPKISGDMCPECGNMLVFEEGCSKCRNCGYSRC
jgi:ribonucleoside-diphosphate reductase alpha chain